MSGAIGYIARAAFDAQNEVQTKGDELRDERKLSLEAEELQYFWWPILFRLQFDSAIWRGIASTHPNDRLLPMKSDLVDNQLLPNHDEVVKIILSKFYLASPYTSDKLRNWFLQYIDHVAVYHEIRNGIRANKDGYKDYTPENLGKPFPGKPDYNDPCLKKDPDCNLFVKEIGDVTDKLQKQYDADKQSLFEHQHAPNWMRRVLFWKNIS